MRPWREWCRHPRTDTRRADGDVIVYSLDREAFETLIDQHPWLTYHIMRAVTRTAHNVVLGLNAQIEELSNSVFKAHGRY